MLIAIIKFIVAVIAIIASLLWLSGFVADIVNPVISAELTPVPRNTRFWGALVAAIAWAALIAFF